jgi:hypothetical protein
MFLVSLIAVAADVNAKVNLVSTVSLNVVDMLTLSATADPYLLLKSRFQYPAFPALTDPRSNPESLRSFGECNVPHLVESDLQAGVDQVSATLVVDIQALSPLKFKTRQSKSLGPFGPESLISGCLLSAGQVAKLTLTVGRLAYRGFAFPIVIVFDSLTEPSWILP